MAKVLVLPDHIASQIAAGEVVERPASVVKELVENCLDAGASEIEIAISADCRDIRVADNGQGMEPEDAVLAFQRHATSKLRSADDLWALNTLGFRGEALPSIASISRFTCYTRTHEAATGTKITSADGELKATETGCSPGTVMEVLELFYNTPARLKFMKKAATEFGHIEEIVQSLAIAYQNVAFTLINDGEVVMRTSGQGALDSTIVQAGFFSGREPLVEVLVEESSNGFSIHGYLAKPTHFRGDRKGILTIVNKRAVRCPLTLKALDYAYSDLIPRGRYPLAVVKIELDPSQVDVNIHPTKKELKYSNGNGIYLSIQRALTRALRQEAMDIAAARASEQQAAFAAAYAMPAPATHTVAANADATAEQSIVQSVMQKELSDLDRSFLRTSPSSSQARPAQLSFNPQHIAAEETPAPAQMQALGHLFPQARSNQTDQLDSIGLVEAANQISFTDSLTYKVSEETHHQAPYKRDIGNHPLSLREDDLGQERNGEQIESDNLPAAGEHFIAEPGYAEAYELPAGYRMMGYLKNTYIFFETHEGLEIIEQHIAHERTLYERLLAGQNSETPGRLNEHVQKLLVSAPLNLTKDQNDVLKQSSQALAKLGFEFNWDDSDRASVSQLPVQLAQVNYVPVIQKMVDELATVNATNMELEATKSIACQSAIKNGMPLSQRDILKLVSDWLKTERRDTCPHGRPVRLKFTMPELFELFHPA
ncbi:MAG: DNA mismatch repair endonuclease MutL [Cyanobacteria bacterium REEB67]|nr:DNA mismatch repair endonuclease MutL [Cyanobacteria bacterium REEB67]